MSRTENIEVVDKRTGLSARLGQSLDEGVKCDLGTYVFLRNMGIKNPHSD